MIGGPSSFSYGKMYPCTKFKVCCLLQPFQIYESGSKMYKFGPWARGQICTFWNHFRKFGTVAANFKFGTQIHLAISHLTSTDDKIPPQIDFFLLMLFNYYYLPNVVKSVLPLSYFYACLILFRFSDWGHRTPLDTA